ncbi:MAG: GIY-YIG nuclease family protein [Patescibacteria group bacterium]
MWLTYILLCKDGSYYTGITNNLDKRLSDHKKGLGGAYTRAHKPLRLVHKENFLSKSLALKRESEIKKLSKAQKTMLIEAITP